MSVACFNIKFKEKVLFMRIYKYNSKTRHLEQIVIHPSHKHNYHAIRGLSHNQIHDLMLLEGGGKVVLNESNHNPIK